MARVRMSVDLSGPLFHVDLAKTFRQNARSMLEGLASEGERLVRSDFPVYTGAGREGVKGRVSSLGGKRWALTAVVSEQHIYPWPGGGAKQYRGGKLEARRHMFKRAASAMRRTRAVLSADLAKGMN